MVTALPCYMHGNGPKGRGGKGHRVVHILDIDHMYILLSPALTQDLEVLLQLYPPTIYHGQDSARYGRMGSD